MASNIPVIVQGNSFSLAIPLQIYYINGDQMDLEDYTPDPTDEISIQLKGERRQYTYTPTVDGNICNIDLSGNELAGNYSVVVSIVKASGQRLRSFRTDQFFIVESSDDLTPADIIEGLEENVIYLNSSIFVAGEDGRGITSIVKTSTSGLVDTYTITYSDNTTSTFNVTNGAAGEAGATIASVAKTATAGKVDTYTITMTDGATFNFEVTNGLDGVDLGLANIVDDLTTGGSNNVLSAEMGKVLNDTTPKYTNNDNPSDLDVADEDGYVLARFADGHFQTKNFNSLICAKKDYQKDNYFSLDTETTQPNTANLDSAVGINTYTAVAVYSDFGVLYLPSTYERFGTPCKLVICCKWGGTNVTASSSPVFNINIFDYIRHLGYAILMMDGEPDAWLTSLGLDSGYTNGNYVAVQSFMRGYDKVVKDWNIDKDGCYIFGYSQGGWCASNIVDNSNIPIKACALLSPVLSLEWQSWNSTNTHTFDGQTYKGMKYRLAKVFGITGWSTPAELDAIPFNPETFGGYDPYMNGAINPFRSFTQNGGLSTVDLPVGTTLADITMQRPLRCPYKIWVASNDSTIGNVPTRVFAKAARNAGSICSLKFLSSGGHNIYNGQTSIGTFVDDAGTTKNIYPIAYEVGKWFEDFGGYGVTI